MSKNINEMNYYEQAKKVHANAVDKGFWDKPHSNEHYFMLVITEATEAVEAHRKGRTASIPEGIEDFPDKTFILSFEAHIKDTVEDELADAVIRLLDLLEYLAFERGRRISAQFGRYKAFGSEFTQLVCDAVYEIVDGHLAPQNRCVRGISEIQSIAERLNIDLERHVRLKMRYNATRPRLHGKKY